MHGLSKLSRQCRLILEGHLLNPFWHSKEERRKRRFRALEKTYMSYLKPFKDFTEKLVANEIPSDTEPERVFSIWFQGEYNAPEIVKACFQSMRRNLRQELVVLDEHTIFDWITLPDHIINKWRRGLISRTHFSDICRVELLYQHGGIWLDSTCFVTGSVPDDILSTDFFVYMAGTKLQRKFTYIQNCFILSRKLNPLLGLWRAVIFEYWNKEDGVFDYYTHQLLFCFLISTNKQAHALFEKMPKIDQDPTHRLWYGGHKDSTYTPTNFKEATADAFFQKTSYKDASAIQPKAGSISEYIIKFQP